MEVQTERLVLKPFSKEDKEMLLRLLTDEVVGRTYMVPKLQTKEQKNAMFKRLETLSLSKERYVAGIYLDGRLIGMFNDMGMDEKEIELGYAFLPQYHNQGYATELLAALIAYFFAEGYERVIAGAFEENVASVRVMLKCGMKKKDKEEEVMYQGILHRCVYFEADNLNPFACYCKLRK